LNALSCDSAGQLHQLITELGATLDIKPDKPDAYQVHINRVMSTPAVETGGQSSRPLGRSVPPPRSLNLEERDALADLPTEARELLAEAAKDRSGSILVARSMQGTSVSTNGRSFTEQDNARSQARAMAAIRQLLERGLLDSEGDGSVLSLTDDGFRMADLLDAL
jgi:hypothetical protein